MQKEQFDITGMTCSACSTRVEKSVAKLPGIKEVSVNLLKNSMVASYDESVLDTTGIVQAVEKAGYGAIPKASAQNKSRTTTPAAKPEVSTAQAEYKQMKQRLLLSALFTIPLFYISMGHMMGWPLPSSLLGMGIEAAAYATIFSQFVQAAITLWYFKKKSPHVKIGRIRIDGELLPQVLSVGISALLMQILTLVQQTVIYRVASNYGGETSQLLLAAALRFWNFSFVPLWGISQGFQPAAGTNYGAKDYDRVKTLTRVFIIAATLLSLVFYIPAELFPEKILSMFLTTPGIAASGSTNFRIMFSTYILQGSFMIAVTLFQSLGKAKKATWLVLFRQIILFIPLCVVLPMIGGMGIRGVWLAIALTDAILVAIIAFMVAYEFRKLPATSSVNR